MKALVGKRRGIDDEDDGWEERLFNEGAGFDPEDEDDEGVEDDELDEDGDEDEEDEDEIDELDPDELDL